MSEEDKRLEEWREKLRTKDESWVREQTNRQLQPNVRKREAAEQELLRIERKSELAIAKRRITELETEISGIRSELSNERSGSVWHRWQTIAGLVAAASGWVVVAIMIMGD